MGPQVFVEEEVRTETEDPLDGSDDRFEFMFEDAFFYAANYREFCDSLLGILEKILPTALNTRPQTAP